MKLKIILLLCVGLSFGSVGCKKSDTAAADTAVAETAQQIGDAMASVDEAGGSSGTIASMQGGVQKTFERLAPNDIDQKQSLVAKLFLPQAEAVACDGYGFGTCAGGVITRNFNSCTIGAATFTGTVALTWSNGSACSLAAPPEFITRIPDITVTGRRGATLKITKSGSFGQKMTWASGGIGSKVFSFTNDGINRKFTDAGATVLFDQTTSVTSPITVTGGSRAGRIMNGGTLHVVNNLTSRVCDYVPASVTWTAGCNCPTSGSWTGTCGTDTSTLTITGCGTGTFTDGSTSQSVALDRCGT